MKKTPKNKRWDTHVYLEAAEYKALELRAKREDRSITKIVTLMIRQALATE